MRSLRDFSIGLLVFLIAPAIQSQKIDLEQELKIAADKVTYKNTKGSIVYEGNVSLTQGDLSFQVDRLEAQTEDQKISYIEAIGSPARFRFEDQEKKDQAITGQSGSIGYDVRKKILFLKNKVIIQQKSGAIRAHQIVYDLETQEATAESAEDAGEARQVEVILQVNELMDR